MQTTTLIAGAVLALAASSAYATEYTGYLSVIDEDYGYWQSRPMVVVDGTRTPLDEVAGSSREYVLELDHDLARGLVRQYTQQREAATGGAASAAAATSLDAAGGGRSPSEPPSGDGEWVFLYEFPSFGFGQYTDSDATHHVYCARGARVWSWLAGGAREGLSGDEAADRLVRDENGMARLKLVCEDALPVTH